MLFSSSMVLQLVQKEYNNDIRIEQSWPQLIYCTLIFYYMYDYLFWSSRMLFKREINSEIRSFIVENTIRIWEK